MNDLIKLSEVCELIGMTEKVAKRRAAKQLLPFPVFRLSGTQKGDWFLQKSVLQEHIERQAANSTPEKLNAVREERMLKQQAKPTVLYRHYDADGQLLYVGISTRLFVRITQHKNNSHWSASIKTIKIERFDTWEQAFEAETRAIQSEKPIHNRAKVVRKVAA